ncbi:hypothetical protein ACGFYV_03830 [Streptomyces sp. NPDC048297]|uniref:hypothetical protein n=1 Tax=Streptomyces sp. NPDC048297 TaxID=3365531 RepID=UPI0037172033
METISIDALSLRRPAVVHPGIPALTGGYLLVPDLLVPDLLVPAGHGRVAG